MPTYSYACKECDNRFDIVQSFSDDSLTVCPACSGPLRKLFNAVGIVFKGSGFYRTDSRGGSVSESAGTGSEKKSDSGSSTTEKKSDSSTSTTAGGDKKSTSSTSSSTPSAAAASS